EMLDEIHVDLDDEFSRPAGRRGKVVGPDPERERLPGLHRGSLYGNPPRNAVRKTDFRPRVVLSLQRGGKEVHARRANEACYELRGGPVVQVVRTPDLLNAPI